MPHARQVGQVHEDVEPLQRRLVLAQHLIRELLDDLPVRSEIGLPEGGLITTFSPAGHGSAGIRESTLARPRQRVELLPGRSIVTQVTDEFRRQGS